MPSSPGPVTIIASHALRHSALYIQEKYGAIAFESGIYVLAQNLSYERASLELEQEIAPATQAVVLALGKYKGATPGRDFRGSL